MLGVRACAHGLNLVVLLLCTSELDRSESIYLLEESASPFIDEGDGFTSEREGVRSSLSLATHANGYKMMVGTHNTVECQMHVGGCVVFFGYDRRRRCHTVDTWGLARGFTMFAWYGKCRCPQHRRRLRCMRGSLTVFVWYES